ncbi:MAG: hypothetical protein IH804_05300 [Planctomycetes bacterium]|nr:hypothetical protein [Planctomycetota bacterium]
MRERDGHIFDNRRPSGPPGPPGTSRVGARGCVPERLAGEVIRLARLATAIHLYESARLITWAEEAHHRSSEEDAR